MSERVRAPGGEETHKEALLHLCESLLLRLTHSPLRPPPNPSSDLQLVSRLLAPERSRKKSFPTVHDPQGVTVSVSRDCCSQAEPSVSAANDAATFALCSAVFGLFVRPSPDHMQPVCSCACSQDVAVRLAVTHFTRVSV